MYNLLSNPHEYFLFMLHGYRGDRLKQSIYYLVYSVKPNETCLLVRFLKINIIHVY